MIQMSGFAWSGKPHFQCLIKMKRVGKMNKLIALSLVLILALLLVSCGSSGSTKYHVGVSQLAQHPALDAATQGFIDALTEKLGDSVQIEVKNASGDASACTTIAQSFVSDGVDLIMANATSALSAAASATADIPILGTSITEYGVALDLENFSGVTGRNVSGTSDLAPLDGQAQLLHDLFPDAKSVGILYCSGEPNSRYQVTEITVFLNAYGYEVKEFSFTDSNDVAPVTQQACDESDVIYIPTDNTAADCAETINNIALVAKTPIIAGEEGICHGCGVATLTISYYDIGYATGLMAYEILANGADVSQMPIEYAPEFVKKYNPAIADQYGLVFGEEFEAVE